jgi:hypothetical protein
MVEQKRVIGSYAQVMHGTATHTSGGLTEKDLEYNKNGKIVSKKRAAAARRNKNLGKCLVKKGSKGFQLVKKNCKTASKRKRSSSGRNSTGKRRKR